MIIWCIHLDYEVSHFSVCSIMKHAFFSGKLLGLNIILAYMLVPFAVAQVHYDKNGYPWKERVDEGPDKDVPGWYYNLGISGIRAELIADRPKVLLVRHVIPRSPARQHVRINDLIVGVGDEMFKEGHRNGYGPDFFGGDGPIKEFAEAIENSQGSKGDGNLILLIERDGERIKKTIKLGKKHGTYADTFPEDCEKSEQLLEDLLKYLYDNRDDSGCFDHAVHDTFMTLAFLSSDSRKYHSEAKRCIKAVCETIENEDIDREGGLMNWTYMGLAVCLSEYYLLKKEKWALDELKKVKKYIDQGQYLDMSQISPKVKETHPEDYPEGPEKAHGGWGHNPGFEGYGPIAMITAQGAMVYSLMEKCGIEIEESRIEAAYDFLLRGSSSKGYMWYADEVGGGDDDWADIGRTGAATIAEHLYMGKEVKVKSMGANRCKFMGDHPTSFPDTHASPTLGMAFAAAGASFDKNSFRKLMDANKWWFTMAQCHDNSFYYQPNRDNAGYDENSRIEISSVVAFIYGIPNKKLVITGRK